MRSGTAVSGAWQARRPPLCWLSMAVWLGCDDVVEPVHGPAVVVGAVGTMLRARR